MQLIEIDIIGLEVFQAEIDRDPDILSRAFALPLNMQHVVTDLGRQLDLIPVAFQRIADIDFRQPVAIAFCRIKKGNPGIQRAVDNLG